MDYTAALAGQHAGDGAAFLDGVLPGWRQRVDPDRLSITSSADCVLGQVCGSYEAGVDALRLRDLGPRRHDPPRFLLDRRHRGGPRAAAAERRVAAHHPRARPGGDPVSGMAERVAAGAALMDGVDLRWWRHDAEYPIDLDALDLGETDRCILGQACPAELAGKYAIESPYAAYAEHLAQVSDFMPWAIEHGFTLPLDAGPVAWAALTAEWKQLILTRRGEAPAELAITADELARIKAALATNAEVADRRSRTYSNSGPANAAVRAEFRRQAAESDDLAKRLAAAGPGSVITVTAVP